MKKIASIVCLILVLTFFSGCLTTLYPFFTENDIEFNPYLIGSWAYKNEKDKGVVYFEPIAANRLQELAPGIRKLADKGYFVTRKKEDGSIESLNFVFLTKVGRNYYLDYYPAEMDFEKQVDHEFKSQYVKMHRCYKISNQNKDSFSMSLLEASFLDDLIDKKKIHIRYEEVTVLNKSRVITAPTQDLRQYLLKYGDEPGAYNKDNSYACTRITNH